MIRYKSDVFGLRTLMIWNGSAAFRAVVPASFSTGLVLVYGTYWGDDLALVVENPYTIGALIGFFGFLLTTRLNFSYQRYWEAATMLHQMTSKFADSAICLASFHYQSDILYQHAKPRPFGCHANNAVTEADYVDDNDIDDDRHGDEMRKDETKDDASSSGQLTRQHSRTNSSSSTTLQEASEKIDSQRQHQQQQHQQVESGGGGTFFRWIQDTFFASYESEKAVDDHKDDHNDDDHHNSSERPQPKSATSTQPTSSRRSNDDRLPDRATSEPLLLTTKSFQPNQKQLTSKSGHRLMQASQTPTPLDWTTAPRATRNQPTIGSLQPSPFLQEAVHLYSLMNAVALASLRHDVEGCPSPLSEYIPNQPFPPYNPNHFDSDHKSGHLLDIFTRKYHSHKDEGTKGWYQDHMHLVWNAIYFLAGMDRSPKQRTLYNAARPFAVLGGVSDAEASRLQQARGSMAQLALCQFWLKEFVTREYLHGSTGKVAPPIVGRVYHFLTDGNAAYHQCRKVAYIPFPFPHAQMTSLFTFLILFIFPVLCVAFCNNSILACCLNFMTILCFKGIHEVARELTNPYHTVPNDLPLNRFHAQFNETLRVTLTGFHPDGRGSGDGATDGVETRRARDRGGSVNQH